MKKGIHGCVIAVAIGSLTSVTTLNSSAGNVLVDPGFEPQTPPEQGGWIPFNGAGLIEAYPRTGSWSMAAVSYWTWAVPGSFEQFPAAPGSQWRLTGYGMAPYPLQNTVSFAILQVSFFDIFGNDLGTVETAGTDVKAKVSNPVDQTSDVSTWIFLDTGVATAPSGTAFIQAFTLLVDSGETIEGVYFDDLDLEVLGVTHGQYVAGIAKNMQPLVAAGFLTRDAADAIIEVAAESAAGKN